MPASVANAAPTTVLPAFLCRSFLHSRQYNVDQTDYANGERQTRLVTTSSRKSWQLEPACSAAVLASLSDFYLARKGSLQPFYFYDLTQGGVTHDPTGVATTGRYTVHFNGPYQHDIVVGKSYAQIELVELA